MFCHQYFCWHIDQFEGEVDWSAVSWRFMPSDIMIISPNLTATIRILRFLFRMLLQWRKLLFAYEYLYDMGSSYFVYISEANNLDTYALNRISVWSNYYQFVFIMFMTTRFVLKHAPGAITKVMGWRLWFPKQLKAILRYFLLYFPSISRGHYSTYSLWIFLRS